MKKWFIVDDTLKTKGYSYEFSTPAQTREEAEDLALDLWECFSDEGKAMRGKFSVVLAEAYEDGELNWEAVEEEIRIK